MINVLVIGGGNAALCAALTAREAGASVLLLEAAPREWRGGNSQHTRNLRCMHDAPQDVLTDAYSEDEFWQDLVKVTGGQTDERLARLMIRASATCRDWMRRHGVHFQPSLSGTLHLSRTNAFFMGGGKALVNAYYRSAEALDVAVRYDAPVDRIETVDGCFVAAHVGNERIAARTCVVASGGFESNRAWLRDAWGQNDRGEWPADNFAVRGTRYNMGVVLRDLIDRGADTVGDPTQSHCVAIDARAPLYDGGICTRVARHHGQPRRATVLRRRRGLLAEALRDLGPARRAAAGPDRLLDHRCKGDRPVHAARVSGEECADDRAARGPAWPRRGGAGQDRVRLQRGVPCGNV